jgi:hypothetical protein
MKRLAPLLLIASSAVAANEADRLLSSLPAEKQRQALAHIVTSSGDACPGGNRVMRQGAKKDGTAYWNVGCTNGKSYLVELKADAQGSTKVLSCTTLKALNAGTCFTKF